MQQLHHSTIHNQTKGNQIVAAMRHDLDSSHPVSSAQGATDDQTHAGQTERVSERTVEETSLATRRMVPRSDSLQLASDVMVRSGDRLICHSMEHKDGQVCTVGPGSKGLEARCHVVHMEQSSPICIHTIRSNPSGSGLVSAHSTVAASSPVVSFGSQFFHGHPPHPPIRAGSPDPCSLTI